MGEHVVLLPQHVQGEQMHSCASFREETLERLTFTAKIHEVIYFTPKARRGQPARGLQRHPEELRRVAAQGVRGQGGDGRHGAREEHPRREGLPRATQEDVRLQRARLIINSRVE